MGFLKMCVTGLIHSMALDFAALCAQNEVLPDRFVVCGESYKDLRELLAEIVIGKDVEALSEKVQVNSQLVSFKIKTFVRPSFLFDGAT